MKKFFALSLFIVPLLAFWFVPKNEVAYRKTVIVFQNVSVTADVADTFDRRVQGLSGRKELSGGTGMWFDFGTERPPKELGFWMKDMNFPIDMIWLDGSLRVIFVKENAASSSYPEVFAPDKPGRYVLEVPAGFSQKNGIKVGDMVKVQKSS